MLIRNLCDRGGWQLEGKCSSWVPCLLPASVFVLLINCLFYRGLVFTLVACSRTIAVLAQEPWIYFSVMWRKTHWSLFKFIILNTAVEIIYMEYTWKWKHWCTLRCDETFSFGSKNNWIAWRFVWWSVWFINQSLPKLKWKHNSNRVLMVCPQQKK